MEIGFLTTCLGILNTAIGIVHGKIRSKHTTELNEHLQDLKEKLSHANVVTAHLERLFQVVDLVRAATKSLREIERELRSVQADVRGEVITNQPQSVGLDIGSLVVEVDYAIRRAREVGQASQNLDFLPGRNLEDLNRSHRALVAAEERLEAFHVYYEMWTRDKRHTQPLLNSANSVHISLGPLYNDLKTILQLTVDFLKKNS